jgi:hypothetical protein
VKVGLPDILDLVGEEDVGRPQLLRGYLVGTVEAAFEILSGLTSKPTVLLSLPKATATGSPA